MKHQRIWKERSVFTIMNLLKFFIVSVSLISYFVWTRESDYRVEVHTRDWFQENRLNCKYCRKKRFKNLLRVIKFDDGVHNSSSVSLTLQEREEKCELDEKFLSFTLDTLELKRNLLCFPLSSPKINKLVSSLSPAYFRVGGTPQDFLYFTDRYDIDAEEKDNNTVNTIFRTNCTPKFENWRQMKPFNFTVNQFEELRDFTQRNNLSFIFGLNAKVRDTRGYWSGINAKKVFKGYKNIHFLLGNEPNRFNKYGKRWEVSPSQLAKDIRILRKLVSNSSMLFGPDISRPSLRSLQYYKNFVKSNPSIDAFTYHLYEMHRSQASKQNFLNPLFLHKLREEMEWISNITKSRNDIWVGETGSASGGGAPGFSDRFISGFFYLGKIGLATEMCHKVLVRQSFYGGYYGMLHPVTYDPLPDYWSSLLFKRLIGSTVLSLKISNFTDPKFLVHAYCSKSSNRDVTIMFVNMNQNSARTIRFTSYNEITMETYILSNRNNLTSSEVYLNNNLLVLDENNALPLFKPVLVKSHAEIPKLTYGFIVLKDISFRPCLPL